MLKKDIELKKTIKIDEVFNCDSINNFNHALLKKINKIKVLGALKYQETIKCLKVEAKIITDIDLIDARDGKLINIKNEEYDWNDEYFFEEINNDQVNVVLGAEFDILEYAIEQIVLNIPINFTNNYGKISFVGKDFTFMSEEEYQQEQEKKQDPRWDKLKEFKF
ncbi:YceD family protein [Spiroplasma tabanidicola]|uniref:DUF177 domain-containing protein n=1 Tax=Spiroplasma tabanidicola TaxID=324079 RepID=A0A6I6CDW8_9MOLU|nr:YceD family protein [Spiroplasma tabanidicola]QGS52164.1 hypothetical protein STABA_v1c08080 [Spiroplasma tabanidicola]